MTPQWFEADEGDTRRVKRESLAARLDSAVCGIYDSPRESARRSEMLYDLELYFGRRIATLFEIGDVISESPFSSDRLRFNHCFSICSTVRNRICSFRPSSEFVPSSGNSLAKSGAEDLSAMNEAWSVKQGRQATMALWFRDLLTCDGGVVKIYRDGDTVELGRFPPWEFMVDEVDGLYGKTQTIHHVQYLPLETVAARYRIDPSELRAEATSMRAGMPYASDRQVVRVSDSYACAEGDESPGRHVILVGRTRVALDEEWEWDEPPVVLRAFEEGMTGTWGVSAVRMLRGIQAAQNEWTERMENAHYMSSLQVWQVGADEDGPTKINNADVRIERYKARASNVINPPPMGPEAYRYSELLEQQGYKTIGVSAFIAAGIKQPQTSSGVAIDSTSELQSDRLALLSQTWEEGNNKVDVWWMRLTTKAARDGVQFKWRGINKGAWRELVFGDGIEEWEVRPKATSVFGQTVAARLTKATELFKAGAIDIEQWTEAVQLPDLKPITDLRLAEQKLMERIVDRVLEDGDLRMPGPYVDPKKMFEYARARYNLAEADDGKYSALSMSELRRLIDAVGVEAGIIPPPNLPAPVTALAPAPAAGPAPAGVPGPAQPTGPLGLPGANPLAPAGPPVTITPTAPPIAPPGAAPPAMPTPQ